MPVNYTPHATPFRINADEFNTVYEELDIAIESLRGTPSYTGRVESSTGFRSYRNNLNNYDYMFYSVAAIPASGGNPPEGNIMQMVTSSSRDASHSSRIYLDKVRAGGFFDPLSDGSEYDHEIFYNDTVFDPSQSAWDGDELGALHFRVGTNNDANSEDQTGLYFTSASIKALTTDNVTDSVYGSEMYFGVTVDGSDTYREDTLVLSPTNLYSPYGLTLGSSTNPFALSYFDSLNLADESATSVFATYTARSSVTGGVGHVVHSASASVEDAPFVSLYRSSGSSFTTPTAVASGANLGKYTWQGWDGSGYFTSAAIQAYSNAAWNGSNKGTDIYFSLYNVGSNSLVNNVRLSDGTMDFLRDSYKIRFTDSGDFVAQLEHGSDYIGFQEVDANGENPVDLFYYDFTDYIFAVTGTIEATSDETTTHLLSTTSGNLFLRLEGNTGGNVNLEFGDDSTTGIARHTALPSTGDYKMYIRNSGDTAWLDSFTLTSTGKAQFGTSGRTFDSEVEFLTGASNNVVHDAVIGGAARWRNLYQSSQFLFRKNFSDNVYSINFATKRFRHFDTVQFDSDLDHDGSKLGFFGVAPATRPTVTGSWGGNVAGASLAAALQTLGLIINSTT